MRGALFVLLLACLLPSSARGQEQLKPHDKGVVVKYTEVEIREFTTDSRYETKMKCELAPGGTTEVVYSRGTQAYEVRYRVPSSLPPKVSRNIGPCRDDVLFYEKTKNLISGNIKWAHE